MREKSNSFFLLSETLNGSGRVFSWIEAEVKYSRNTVVRVGRLNSELIICKISKLLEGYSYHEVLMSYEFLRSAFLGDVKVRIPEFYGFWPEFNALVLEYLNYERLDALIYRLNINNASEVDQLLRYSRLCGAILYKFQNAGISGNPVLYVDFSPKNILVDGDCVALIDPPLKETIGQPTSDISVFMFGVLRHSINWKILREPIVRTNIILKLRRSFLNGYYDRVVDPLELSDIHKHELKHVRVIFKRFFRFYDFPNPFWQFIRLLAASVNLFALALFMFVVLHSFEKRSYGKQSDFRIK